MQLCERALTSLKYFCEDAPDYHIIVAGSLLGETKDYILVRHIQDTILTSYLNDMSKYNNLNEIKKTMPEPDGCQIPGVGIPVNQTHTAEKTTYIRQGFFCIV